jgi:PAS domain S-box-containing protein
MTEANEDELLRSVVLQNAERIRVARLRAEQHAEATLREQAQLLNLTHDAIVVLDMEGTIKYWNRGAEELYGWPAEQAIGNVIEVLLKTVFPVPLEMIEEEVTRTGRWEGELVHTKRDGSQVVVASRWSLQRDERSATTTSPSASGMQRFASRRKPCSPAKSESSSSSRKEILFRRYSRASADWSRSKPAALSPPSYWWKEID